MVEIQKSDDGSGQLLIPFDMEEFGAFYSRIVGVSSISNFRIEGSFDLDMQSVHNFYHLVRQRIHQQNEAIAVSIQTQFTFSDGSSHTEITESGFLNFADVRARDCISVSMNFTFLIRFLDSLEPKRQSISIAVVTERLNKRAGIESKGELFAPFDSERASRIVGVIEHTNRGWGEDIENILRMHAASLVTHKKSSSFFYRHRAPIIIGTGLLGSLAVFSLFYPFVAGIIIDSDAHKMQFIDLIRDGIAAKLNVIGILIYLVSAVVLCGLLFSSVDEYYDLPPSFIRLTDKEIYQQKEMKSNYNNRKILSIAVISGSLVLAVVGNILSNSILKLFAD